MQVSIQILERSVFTDHFLSSRIHKDNRGVPGEARCECNDQVEMCG